MSSKYKFVNRDGIYFVTATIVVWVTILTRNTTRSLIEEVGFYPSFFKKRTIES